MESPDSIEGITCEKCDNVLKHTFITGEVERANHPTVSFNGIQCSQCEHITVAWAENYLVRDLFNQWEAARKNFTFEEAFQAQSVALIHEIQEEVNK